MRGALLLALALAALAPPSSASAAFGLLPGAEGFSMQANAEGGKAATVAGSHPYELRARLAFTTSESPGQPGVQFPDGDLRDLTLQMPAGLIANPAALPKCLASDFAIPRSSPFEASASGESCPAETQVGTVEVKTSLGGGIARRFGVFNLNPPAGVTAQIGFAPFGTPVVLAQRLSPGADGQYTLSLQARNFPQAIDVSGLELVLWGTPWGASHDGERGNCLNEVEPSFPWAKCSAASPLFIPPTAYLSMPTHCQGALTYSLSASSWQGGVTVSRSHTPAGVLEDCDALLFEPLAHGQLTNRKASSGTGYVYELENKDQGLTAPSSRVPSQVRTLSVLLPQGTTINPSVGEGLGTCSPGQLAAESAAGPEGTGCPNAAKLGDFTVKTRLFSETLQGALYLARPYENPFGTLLAVYLIARSPERGVLVKVAGRLDPDPASGSLTATFENLPQLPYTDLDLRFREGQRSPLITPSSCGSHHSLATLIPWQGAVAAKQAATASAIDSGIGGGPCPSGVPPFAPTVRAGSVNSNANSYTPFYLQMTRQDTEQEITSYSMVLPRGITGRLAGLPFCPEAQIAAARANGGFAEAANPSCPALSQIGRSISGYGVGPALTYAPGRFYMAGPYRGSPLSIVSVNAATVGPFDLGTIVIRFAFDVDPRTAQLQIDSAGSDPIPHILGGIPLHLRDIRVFMDRPQFTRNPSSCLASKVTSTLGGSGARFGDGADDTAATLANHFQLLNCRTLGFKPRLGIRLHGPARRGAYPALRATFAARGPQDANLKEIEVTMPHSQFLAQNHIRGVCTKVQFAAERCPAGSVYGKAVAHTPLFDQPLRGEVYLRSSSARLPDLVASLRAGAVRITLDGHIGPSKQGIRVRFEDLPDAPIERFIMSMRGGRRGLLTNSSNICASPPIATVKALGQGNLGRVFTTKLRGQCGKKKGRG
jgi:hypothetical protein